MSTTPRDCLRRPPEGTRDREQVDRFAEFLRLVGPPSRVTWFGRYLVANDPEMSGYVHGAYPLTVDDLEQ